MAKHKASLAGAIDPAAAMALVASFTRDARRQKRLELGRVTKLAGLTAEQASFFYGECLVFSQVSEDVNAWIREHFVEKGGTHKNTARLRELYEFYLALTSDVDIRYDLEPEAEGSYDVKDPVILPNDYHIAGHQSP